MESSLQIMPLLRIISQSIFLFVIKFCIYKFIIMTKLQSSRTQHVYHQPSETREIGRINQRIKALLDIKKYQHDDKISEYLRIRNKQAKVKRTRCLRKNHILNLIDKPLPETDKKLSIETLKLYPNRVPNKQKLNKKLYMLRLRQFQQDFTNGKIDTKYEQMLGQYLDQYKESIEDNKQQFIKKATKKIKQKLFTFYLEQYSRSDFERLSNVDYRKQMQTLEPNRYQSLEINKSKQKKKHSRMRSQDFLHKYYVEQKKRQVSSQIPRIYKSPSKFNKVYAQSIHQIYRNQMQNIDFAKKVNEKKRKIKEQTFLLKLKQIHPSLTSNK